jgi:predicted nucleic acid-binding protein
VTTNYILTELVALLSSRYHLPRPQVITAMQAIRADTSIDIVYIDQSIDREAWELLEVRLDKEWSLVDASSFVIMKRFGITQALTTDHHFTQAGFIRLPTVK